MQRYFAIDKKDQQLLLSDSDIRHIKTVMRMQENAEIEVVYDQQLYLCCIQNVKSNLTINVKKTLNQESNKLDVTLIIPVLKEQKMDYILQKSTELGVGKIIPVITERTIVKLDEKGAFKKVERWGKICKEASEQSKRIEVPVIEDIMRLKELKPCCGSAFVLSTITENSIKTSFQNKPLCGKITIVIGPEGGLSLAEEKFLNDIGFESVSLGKRILRVETAPLVVLSILNYIYME